MGTKPFFHKRNAFSMYLLPSNFGHGYCGIRCLHAEHQDTLIGMSGNNVKLQVTGTPTRRDRSFIDSKMNRTRFKNIQ